MSGAARYLEFNAFMPAAIGQYADDNGREVIVCGSIKSDPVFERKGSYYPMLRFVFGADGVYTGGKWRRSCGNVMAECYYSGSKALLYGDRAVIKGRLKLPKENIGREKFDYRKHLRRRGIVAVLKVTPDKNIHVIERDPGIITLARRFLFKIRQDAIGLFHIRMKPPESGMVSAMLFGEKSDFEPELRDVFIKTGTVHIIAISGMHLAVIIMIFAGICGVFGIPKKISGCIVIAAIFGYALTLGNIASVWRAAVMSSVIIAGFIIDRETNLLNNLCFSAIILLGLEPNYLHDPGFILSFACMLSIIFITPVLDGLLCAEKNAAYMAGCRGSGLRTYFLKLGTLTAGVWLGVSPLAVYYFKSLPLLGLFANFAAVPLSMVMIGLGIAAVLLNYLFPCLALYLFNFLQHITAMLIYFMGRIATIPGAYIDLSLVPWYLPCHYFLTVSMIILLKKRLLKKEADLRSN